MRAETQPAWPDDHSLPESRPRDGHARVIVGDDGAGEKFVFGTSNLSGDSCNFIPIAPEEGRPIDAEIPEEDPRVRRGISPREACEPTCKRLVLEERDVEKSAHPFFLRRLGAEAGSTR